jgi:hypothetical protein
LYKSRIFCTFLQKSANIPATDIKKRGFHLITPTLNPQSRQLFLHFCSDAALYRDVRPSNNDADLLDRIHPITYHDEFCKIAGYTCSTTLLLTWSGCSLAAAMNAMLGGSDICPVGSALTPVRN